MKASWSFLLLLWGMILICLAACSAPEHDPAPPAHTAAIVSPTPDDRQEPSPGEHIINPRHTPRTPGRSPSVVTQYILDVTLDYNQKLLDISQTIIYTNNTDQKIENLRLVVPPAYNRGVFFLNSIDTSQTPHKLNPRIRDAVIHLSLDMPLETGQQIEINLEYHLRLPKGAQTLGYTHRQMLLADWYPMIPPYQEDIGWVINPPGRVGEHLVYPMSDFHLNLCLLPTSEGLVVAASTPPLSTQEHCYRYQQGQSRNITLALSPYYEVSTIVDDLVTVTAYTFPEHADYGLRSAALSTQAWRTFTDLFGDNQRDFLSIVEADIFDGLETDGLIFLSDWYYQTADPSPQNYFELLIVHETAHQWFYGYVHNDQANEPWLDEALATYCELLFYEIHQPHLVDWWWQFRVSSFDPQGAVNADIYSFRQFRAYINAVYLRGAYFLQALREEVGDSAFFEGLWHYIHSADPQVLRTSDHFFDAFSQVTDTELSDLISEYFQ